MHHEGWGGPRGGWGGDKGGPAPQGHRMLFLTEEERRGGAADLIAGPLVTGTLCV